MEVEWNVSKRRVFQRRGQELAGSHTEPCSCGRIREGVCAILPHQRDQCRHHGYRQLYLYTILITFVVITVVSNTITTGAMLGGFLAGHAHGTIAQDTRYKNRIPAVASRGKSGSASGCIWTFLMFVYRSAAFVQAPHCLHEHRHRD